MASSAEGSTQRQRTHQDTTEGVDLLGGEMVLENRNPAYVNWWKSLTFGALFALSALGAAANGNISGLMTSGVIAALIGAYVYYSRSQSRYVVTDQRVIKHTGLIRSKSEETRISDIRGISTDQGIIERMASTGTVQVDSTAVGGLLAINGVSDYNGLARTIRNQQQELDSTHQ
jgi:uncharacterized membrane protein YdbT with pleckstrin-like domain